jgi:hypothetical protein
VPPPLIPVGWSLTPDARRFLFITTPDGGRPTPFVVVLNWAAGLKNSRYGFVFAWYFPVASAASS